MEIVALNGRILWPFKDPGNAPSRVSFSPDEVLNILCFVPLLYIAFAGEALGGHSCASANGAGCLSV